MNSALSISTIRTLPAAAEGDIDALHCPEEVLDRSFAINTKSHMFATGALPVMLEKGSGAMIYTSSGAAIGGNAFNSPIR